MTTITDEPRRYGNLRRPGSRGVLGFGWGASIIGFCGLIVTLIGTVTGGLETGLVLFAAVLVAIIPTRRSSKDGRTGYDRWGKRLLNRSNRKAGRHLLVQGPAGFTPDGKLRLPGLLAATELRTLTDPYGSPFGAVIQPHTGHWTIVMECHGTGMDLVDPQTHDREVAHWGQFLAVMGEMPDVDQVQAVVETAPDTGVRLQNQVLTSRSDASPTFARHVMDEVVDAFPAGEFTIRTYVSVTFNSTVVDPTTGRARRLSEVEMQQRISNAVPTILTSLRLAGAGETAHLMGSVDIADMVRVAFDPSVATTVDEARREGGTELRWDEVGPVRLEPYDDRVRHDRAWSASWQMLEPPAGVFSSTQLRDLLRPHPDVMRKRVCLVYRPHNQEDKVRVVEQDINSSTFQVSAKNRVTARQEREISAARQAATEESNGAGVTRFGIIVTLTVAHADDLGRAESALMQMKASARLRLRPALGNQEVALTSGLPLGLVLPKLMRLSESVREYL
ncbi:SCO6880 family protein [Aestuariimicrobium sp. T2.26MG-19.2B]|uniref:SCO6880 family protein n=1 Tax=Aestuariimicrobium sp. T2.26MG-19.2B TaxID=3040679 RepID=UPI0024773A4F|nr:SCO6880 family protein [Aestuariimicrobium sp. T2.26MG-19.2B]CAI9411624.1 hypothetical protein AESSP_02688 [Aestuariimicrobium sp. T2.26MG-19.2B]